MLDQSDERFLERPERGDQFGAAVVTLPRYVTGTQTHLVIGVPGEDVDGVRNAGLAHSIAADSLGFSYHTKITQNMPGIPGSAGTNDHLGAVLAGYPSSGLDSPGAAMLGLPRDTEYPNGAVLIIPYVPIDESDPTEPRYDVRVWVPGRGAFPAGGTEFGAAAAGAHGDFP